MHLLIKYSTNRKHDCNDVICILLQKKKKVKPLPDVDAELLAWSNTDIEYPSTSTTDEVEVLNQHQQQPQNNEQSPSNDVTTQLTDLNIDDKSIAESQQQNEIESLSKFVLDYDASICMCWLIVLHDL